MSADRANDALSRRPLGELLDMVAERTPAPGGGCSAAWTCALAAALVEMTAAFTIGGADDADVHARTTAIAARAGELRGEALRLGEEELSAFAPVLAALRASPERRRLRLPEALSQAADVPLAIAEAAREVAALGAELAGAGNPRLEGDVVTGVLLGEAACRAAVALVLLNLADTPQDPRVARAGELARDAAESRRRYVT